MNTEDSYDPGNGGGGGGGGGTKLNGSAKLNNHVRLALFPVSRGIYLSFTSGTSPRG